MPGSRSIRLHGARRGWICHEVALGRRRILEWLESSLPPETQAALNGTAQPQVCSTAATEAGDVKRSSSTSRNPSPATFYDESGRGATVDARLEIIAAFRRFRSGPLVRDLKSFAQTYCSDPSATGVSEETRRLYPSIAWNTLQRWLIAQESGGVIALLPESGGRRSVIDADPAISASIESLLFANPYHVTARQIRRKVRAEFGISLHIATIQRWVRKWRRINAHAISAVADPDGHRSRRMPAFGDDAADVDELNQVWELDSSPADVICADGNRHSIICAIDVWSRRTRVVLAPRSRSTAIAALIRRCLIDWGVPHIVVSDEGRDYTSRHLRRIYADLGVAHHILPPYSPDKKPFIERFIGTLSRDLFTQLPGFAGHNVADARRLRDRRSFAARRGEDRIETFRCSLSPEQLQTRIDEWCEDIYGREPHSGIDGQSPFEKAASWKGERRRVDERSLDVLLAPPAGDGVRMVGKKGIRVGGAVFIAAELGWHMGERVHVRQDPASPDRIFVFTLEDRPDVPAGSFICVAEDPGRTGADRQRIAAGAKANWRARSRQERKHARDLARTHDPAGVIDAVLERARQDASRVVALPFRGSGHSTHEIAAAASAQAAAEKADAERTGDQTGDRDGRKVLFDAMRKIYGEN